MADKAGITFIDDEVKGKSESGKKGSQGDSLTTDPVVLTALRSVAGQRGIKVAEGSSFDTLVLALAGRMVNLKGFGELKVDGTFGTEEEMKDSLFVLSHHTGDVNVGKFRAKIEKGKRYRLPRYAGQALAEYKTVTILEVETK